MKYLILAICLSLVGCNLSSEPKVEVRVGNVYIYKDENPYRDTSRCCEILEKRNGYVKFRINNYILDNNDILELSGREYLFIQPSVFQKYDGTFEACLNEIR